MRGDADLAIGATSPQGRRQAAGHARHLRAAALLGRSRAAHHGVNRSAAPVRPLEPRVARELPGARFRWTLVRAHARSARRRPLNRLPNNLSRATSRCGRPPARRHALLPTTRRQVPDRSWPRRGQDADSAGCTWSWSSRGHDKTTIPEFISWASAGRGTGRQQLVCPGSRPQAAPPRTITRLSQGLRRSPATKAAITSPTPATRGCSRGRPHPFIDIPSSPTLAPSLPVRQLGHRGAYSVDEALNVPALSDYVAERYRSRTG